MICATFLCVVNQVMKKKYLLLLVFITIVQSSTAQNSLVSNGFGGRLWYKSYNYTTGSYSAYTVCGTDKQLYAWGHNGHRQLGNTSIPFTGSDTPVAVTNMNNVVYYSTGYTMGAIKGDQTGWVWGDSQAAPLQVISDVFFVDAGLYSCAFVKKDGTVWLVGEEQFGEFGDGPQLSPWSTTPVQMQNITNAVRTAQGFFTTLVLLDDGRVFAAGRGAGVGVGLSNATIRHTPVHITGLTDIVDIKSTTLTNLALDKNGDVWTWGSNAMGTSIGLGPNVQRANTPRKMNTLKDIVAISGCADGFHFLAIDKDKNCYGWGRNFQGSLTGLLGDIFVPTLIATDVVEIMAGESFSYIIKSDGSMYATGSNNGVGGGSIWMDLPITTNRSFTKIDPENLNFNLCKPYFHGEPPVIIDYSVRETPDVRDTALVIKTPVVTIPDSSNFLSEKVILFPTAFSPNGDGINNIFRAIIKGGAIVDKYELAIYNRWGQRVFHTNDVYAGWDGTIAAEPQPIGTFYYYARFNTPNRQPRFLKGDFTLIR